MKQMICLIFAICMALPSFIFASSSEETPENSAYPINIIISDDKKEIRKVYEFDLKEENSIAKDEFELSGYIYQYFDMIKEGISLTEKKMVTETVMLQSKSNDIKTILSLLPQTKEMTYEDGFSGTLTLNISSIKVEVSGYGLTTKTLTSTRSYPNLSSADMQNIPKTAEHEGKTLSFESVQWQTDNTMNVDDYEIPDRYTAIVTYAAPINYTYVKGYTVIAEYQGEVTKTYVDKMRYTVIFTGSPKQHFVLMAVLAVLAASGAIIYYRLKNKKENKPYEETELHQDHCSDANHRIHEYPGIGS